MARIDQKFCPPSNNKAQIKVIERDNLLSSSSINTEDNLEEEVEEEEAGEVDNGYNADSEQQLNLEANLNILQNLDDKKDGQKLKCYLPNENEWKLIEELIKTFEQFDKATETFSAEKYPILSIVYPIIELLKFNFSVDPNLLLIDDDLNKEYNEDEKEDYTQNTLDIQSTIALVKQAIYNSLWKYWGNSQFTGLLATLLDPRLKKMHPWPEDL
ncbi:3281_t:CDS:2 [Cetraspora pellucida]|uniref:3281_t:CDS:1 n=1 Tax=Cetraspora pellucida TaxID=1433469 RepID=A0ACA9MWH2_9GLOM|nr:3281_t:CDS:2 [Cetraspora pellucida]